MLLMMLFVTGTGCVVQYVQCSVNDWYQFSYLSSLCFRCYTFLRAMREKGDFYFFYLQIVSYIYIYIKCMSVTFSSYLCVPFALCIEGHLRMYHLLFLVRRRAVCCSFLKQMLLCFERSTWMLLLIDVHLIQPHQRCNIRQLTFEKDSLSLSVCLCVCVSLSLSSPTHPPPHSPGPRYPRVNVNIISHFMISVRIRSRVQGSLVSWGNDLGG